MRHARSSNQTYLLVGVVVPGFVLLVSRFMGVGVSDAFAQPERAPAAELPALRAAPAEPTPPVAAAMEYAGRLTRDLGIPSPFEEATVIIDRAGTAGTASARSGSASSGVRVTAILIDARRTIAVVDGNAFTIGDEVSPGWRLVGIDRRSGEVRLRHASGATEIHAIHRFD
ncbi:MAG: hypothetical protein RIB32_00690 [Phycisphaerales bacterium]